MLCRAFEDEVSEGRSKSLGASLSYGFEHAFSEEEREQLALLHFFQGFVDVEVLRAMGTAEVDWRLPEVGGLTRPAGIALLNRATEVGLLTAQGNGYYYIHPALPWYFKKLLNTYYPASSSSQSPIDSAQSSATHAFAEAMGLLGHYCHSEYIEGNREVIQMLNREEANLLHARHLARTNSWWHALVETMQGLQPLYEQTGRRAEWKRLVDEIIPDFANPNTDAALGGLEEEWSIVTHYRVTLAGEAEEWAKAEELQTAIVAWNRQRAAVTLAVLPGSLDPKQRTIIQALAASVHELGRILVQQRPSECVALFKEAISLYRRASDKTGEATSSFNLGSVYLEHDELELAEHHYRLVLELCDEHDRLGRGKGHYSLGNVARKRFFRAREVNTSAPGALLYLRIALQQYQQALHLLPLNAVEDLAVVHFNLGIIYDQMSDHDSAVGHFQEAIRKYEEAGDLFEAARSRLLIGYTLLDANRLENALEYAGSALRNFETFRDPDQERIERARELIVALEQALKGDKR